MSDGRAQLVGLGLLLALGACAPPAGNPTAPAPATAPASAPAEATKTTLWGVARDAKGGAVVVTERGPLYVLGLDAWPRDLVGRRIEVVGVVQRRKLIPDPVGPGGTLAQGAWGEQLVIVEATWRAIE